MKSILIGGIVISIFGFFLVKMEPSFAAPKIKAICNLTSDSNVETFLNEKCDLSKHYSLAGASGGVLVCCSGK